MDAHLPRSNGIGIHAALFEAGSILIAPPDLNRRRFSVRRSRGVRTSLGLFPYLLQDHSGL